jgi:hypothetical protein
MLASLLLLQVAAATPEASAAPEPLTHYHQFGLSLAPGAGYRFIAPYNEGEPCGQNGKRVCLSHVPAFLELEMAFGITASLDLIADLRFGVEQDYTTTTDFFFAPGIKYFIDPNSLFKLYTTIQLVFDHEDESASGVDNFDFAIRNANGLQLDLWRNFGVFAQLGETLGFVRWLRIEIDVAGGVQGRFP